jgi:hypothetical protein
MKTKNEVWKPIEGYEGVYEISSLGRVKSFWKYPEGKILKPSLDTHGYLIVSLCKDKKKETAWIHRLVAIAFLGHTPNGQELVINHKDGDTLNNYLSNLEIVTQRRNLTTCFRKDREKLSSKYPGVSWNKEKKKWAASVYIKKKHVLQKYFDSELEAAAAYKSKLIELGLN